MQIIQKLKNISFPDHLFLLFMLTWIALTVAYLSAAINPALRGDSLHMAITVLSTIACVCGLGYVGCAAYIDCCDSKKVQAHLTRMHCEQDGSHNAPHVLSDDIDTSPIVLNNIPATLPRQHSGKLLAAVEVAVQQQKDDSSHGSIHKLKPSAFS